VECYPNELVLINKQLKESTKIDFVRRLICLFIYYYELDGRDRVSRTELTNILEEISVNNSHAKAWLADNKELVTYADGIGLSQQGREFAAKVLTQIIDPSFQAPAPKLRTRASKSQTTEAASKSENDSSRTRKSGSSSTAGRLGPSAMLDHLITEGFFSQRRTVKDLISHCSSSFAYHYKNSDFTAPLTRLLRNPKRLNREKNSDGQYEYFT
jgi:hypothetical protein